MGVAFVASRIRKLSFLRLRLGLRWRWLPTCILGSAVEASFGACCVC